MPEQVQALAPQPELELAPVLVLVPAQGPPLPELAPVLEQVPVPAQELPLPELAPEPALVPQRELAR